MYNMFEAETRIKCGKRGNLFVKFQKWKFQENYNTLSFKT